MTKISNPNIKAPNPWAGRLIPYGKIPGPAVKTPRTVSASTPPVNNGAVEMQAQETIRPKPRITFAALIKFFNDSKGASPEQRKEGLIRLLGLQNVVARPQPQPVAAQPEAPKSSVSRRIQAARLLR